MSWEIGTSKKLGARVDTPIRHVCPLPSCSPRTIHLPQSGRWIGSQEEGGEVTQPFLQSLGWHLV